MSREILVDDFKFNYFSKPALTASGVDGPWVKADTSAAGSPTIQTATGGTMNLAFDNTNAVQNLCLYFGDILGYTLANLISVDFWVKASSASLNAVITGAVGVGTARNDTLASVTTRAFFKFAGGSTNAITCDATDGTNSNVDKATGEVLTTTLKRFNIAFKEGNRSQVGALSTGGLSNIIFSIENSRGLLRRVADTVRFDMSAASATQGVQPIIQFQKTASAQTGTLSIARVRVVYRQL